MGKKRSSQAWKDLERKAAKMLNGRRNFRGADFSQSGVDVEHRVFVVECKSRRSIPALIKNGLEQAEGYDGKKIPLLVIKEKGKTGEISCMDFKTFVNIYNEMKENIIEEYLENLEVEDELVSISSEQMTKEKLIEILKGCNDDGFGNQAAFDALFEFINDRDIRDAHETDFRYIQGDQ